MRSFHSSAFLLSLAAAACLAVGCGGGGGSSPTETRRDSLTIDVTLHSVSGAATIIRSSLHLDGSRLGTFSSSTPTSSARMDTTVPAEAGDHVVAAQIDEQTGAPTLYRVTGTVLYKGSTTDLGETSASLETGGRVEVRFHL